MADHTDDAAGTGGASSDADVAPGDGAACAGDAVDAGSQDRPASAPARRPAPRDDGPVIPDRAVGGTDEAWGEAGRERSDEWYQSERPPHHGSV